MMLHKNVSNALKTIYIIILFLIFTNISLQAQNNNPSFKFGLEAGVGLFKPNDINQLIDSWLHEQFNQVEIQGDISIRPDINLSGYIAYALIDFLEMRFEMEYIYSPTIFDSFDSEGLNIMIQAYSPGISLNLKWGILQVGGGIFRYFSKIKWEDNVFYFSDNWEGDNYGYHINMGMNRELSTHFGFSSNVLYRNIVIEELRNKNNQVLIHIPEQRNFTFDLSGFEVRLGLYYTF